MRNFFRGNTAKKIIWTAATAVVVILLVIAGRLFLTAEPDNPINKTSVKEITIETGETAQALSDAVDKLGETYVPPQPEDENQPQDEPEQDTTDASSEENGQDQTGENPDKGDINGDKPSPGQNNGNSGNGNGNGGNTGKDEDPGTELGIRTDLKSGTIYDSELENDTLNFYAEIVNGDKDMKLVTRFYNKNTSANGIKLTSEDGLNYSAVLAKDRSRYNTFELFIVKDGKTILSRRYNILYVAQLADKDRPTVGDNPPSIVTNLDDMDLSKPLTNAQFTLLVHAETYEGKTIRANGIEVTINGKPFTNTPTGVSTFEYQLWLLEYDTFEGDFINYTIGVKAWDNEGNSRYKEYDLVYQRVDDGDKIGTATIVLDATTVGLDVMEEPYSYEIKQGVPASYGVVEALREWGYKVSSSGTLDTGFYLRRISRGGMADYAEIPASLMEWIKADELAPTGNSSGDSLGEEDFYKGSGWMYAVNGHYAGKGLSEYYLTDGDTLYLRFSVAMGKDIGNGGMSTEGNYSTYCGTWINGGVTYNHKMDDGEIIVEPGCESEGEFAYSCQRPGCTYKETETIPATGHSDYSDDDIKIVEPTEERSGYEYYVCSKCGKEIILREIPYVKPEEPDPDPTPDPEPETGE